MATIQAFTMEHYQAAYTLWRDTPGIGLSSADEPQAIEQYLLRNPGTSFAAFADTALVGTILCGHDGRRGYVHHLVVNPAYRRRGIATQLVTTALNQLRTIGISKCHLFIFAQNKTGIAFWQNVGWTLREDIHIMSKFISEDDGSSC